MINYKVLLEKFVLYILKRDGPYYISSLKFDHDPFTEEEWKFLIEIKNNGTNPRNNNTT